MWVRSVLCYLIWIGLFVWLVPSEAVAIATSAHSWTYRVTSGQPVFDLNLDGVVPLQVDDVTRCTAVLVSDRHLLSAAHCFDDGWYNSFDDVADVTFRTFFDVPEGRMNMQFTADDIQIPSQWVDQAADVAVITLPFDAPPEAPRYPIYGSRDEIGKSVVLAGYGVIRLGSGGAGSASDWKLAGRNRYEASSDALPDDEERWPGDWLVYDFDSGRQQNNTLADMGIASDLGFGGEEAAAARGDSGSPVFIAGAIAGIAAFVGTGYETDLIPNVDGTWGELGFNTRVSNHVDFIVTATDGAVVVVPEPCSIDLALAGLLCCLSICWGGRRYSKGRNVVRRQLLTKVFDSDIPSRQDTGL
jgi:hypothetical protein